MPASIEIVPFFEPGLAELLAAVVAEPVRLAISGGLEDAHADIEGVALSGVRSGGPADKAGLQGGDVIVMFGGTVIKNVYDYTYALDAVKIGEAIEVVVVRDGKRVTLTVVPEARQ